MHKILILGPQGCGKGTQAAILSKKLDIPELSMGALLREAAAEGGDFGLKIAAIQRSGALVSDEIVNEVLQRRTSRGDMANGYIIDGFPRNEEQYRVFARFDMPTAVIVITVPHEVSMERLLRRAEVEKRVDDTPEVIERRLQIYYDETAPMITHFEQHGIVHVIDGVGTIDEVAERIAQLFA